MGNRLSKIYTRTGDDGSTGLGDGSRVAKDDVRVEAYGTVDELNASIGLLRAELPAAHPAQALLGEVQHDLFDLGGELCIPGYVLLKDGQIELIEAEIDALNESLPMLKEFILPGGNCAAATAHLARTVCRRAERRTCSLADAEDNVRALPLQYLNRLSDYLFVLARTLARENGNGEVLWNRKR
ncbi:MAG: ATP:cob(I)alamin adenosyltransferase [Moraxellaceae bacterium]|jgi:cob(I)alamin adenosyltransferase|nr:ATP:cob(I)alamin adenosyltransferase [Moraxellaceae bacterium]